MLSPHDARHLSALIEAARQEADRLGASDVAQRLADQARRVGALAGVRPDEGTRPQDLTTENDE